MGIQTDRHYHPLTDEPDDYRPASEIATAVDPGTAGHDPTRMLLFFENCAPGDRIPLHTHTCDEVIVVDEGDAEVVIGEERQAVGAGAVLFIPAGSRHGSRNVGDGTLRLHAIFPTDEVVIDYLDRNPAPGTEDQAPGRFVVRRADLTSPSSLA